MAGGHGGCSHVSDGAVHAMRLFKSPETTLLREKLREQADIFHSRAARRNLLASDSSFLAAISSVNSRLVARLPVKLISSCIYYFACVLYAIHAMSVARHDFSPSVRRFPSSRGATTFLLVKCLAGTSHDSFYLDTSSVECPSREFL
jgi:hypothetical protein